MMEVIETFSTPRHQLEISKVTNGKKSFFVTTLKSTLSSATVGLFTGNEHKAREVFYNQRYVLKLIYGQKGAEDKCPG